MFRNNVYCGTDLFVLLCRSPNTTVYFLCACDLLSFLECFLKTYLVAEERDLSVLQSGGTQKYPGILRMITKKNK